jgi:hypothetical protein
MMKNDFSLTELLMGGIACASSASLIAAACYQDLTFRTHHLMTSEVISTHLPFLCGLIRMVALLALMVGLFIALKGAWPPRCHWTKLIGGGCAFTLLGLLAAHIWRNPSIFLEEATVLPVVFQDAFSGYHLFGVPRHKPAEAVLGSLTVFGMFIMIPRARALIVLYFTVISLACCCAWTVY